MRTQIWSSGGGVQSSAIASLICSGKLEPPDIAVIVDTERELSTTWDYMDKFVSPALAEAGVTLHRVKKRRFATVDLHSKKGDVLIPAFTSESGSIGKLPTYCSTEWKQRVMRRFCSDVKQADVWIGFSIDELRRVTQPTGKWQHRYPLIEMRMTRGDCIEEVKRMGWPSPPRSSCWMCPNKTHNEWDWQKNNAPKDFERAVKFERYIQTKDEDLWLTDQAKPLEDCDFSQPDDMFSSKCSGGMCFV